MAKFYANWKCRALIKFETSIEAEDIEEAEDALLNYEFDEDPESIDFEGLEDFIDLQVIPEGPELTTE